MIGGDALLDSSSNGRQFLDTADSNYIAELVYWPIIVGSVIILAGALSLFTMLVMLPMLSAQKRDDDDECVDSIPQNDIRYRNRRGSQRFRSFSVSVDLQFLDQVVPCDTATLSTVDTAASAQTGWQRQQLRVLSGASDRYRTMSTNYIERYRMLHHADCADLTAWKLRGLEMLRRVPEAFPFQSLPVDCQLTVFSFLSAAERGTAAQVCTDWNELMHTPTLWTDVDFTSFPLCQRCVKVGRECTPLCYAAYKSRMKSFFRFLFSIHPTIHRLRAAFDIGDHRDGWLDLLQGLLRTARCQELVDVDLNWKETPVKPPAASSQSSNATWSTGDYYDMVFQHRHRQRLFVKFFDMLIAAAPNITRLRVPFDWCERSVRAIARLRRLDTLVLEQYFWMQSVEPSFVEQVVASAPALRRLTLEVWSPSGQGLLSYAMRSESLEHLDVSLCRGLSLGSVRLPRLRSLAISRQPMNGPLSCDAGHRPMDCLLCVLSDGAPALETVNGLRLPKDWNDGGCAGNDAVETLLKNICSCSTHKPSAASS